MSEEKKYTRSIQLNTVGDISKFMCKTINDLRKDKINTTKARTFGYLSNIMLEVLKQNDLEKRLEKLEETLGD